MKKKKNDETDPTLNEALEDLRQIIWADMVRILEPIVIWLNNRLTRTDNRQE